MSIPRSRRLLREAVLALVTATGAITVWWLLVRHADPEEVRHSTFLGLTGLYVMLRVWAVADEDPWPTPAWAWTAVGLILIAVLASDLVGLGVTAGFRSWVYRVLEGYFGLSTVVEGALLGLGTHHWVSVEQPSDGFSLPAPAPLDHGFSEDATEPPAPLSRPVPSRRPDRS